MPWNCDQNMLVAVDCSWWLAKKAAQKSHQKFHGKRSPFAVCFVDGDHHGSWNKFINIFLPLLLLRTNLYRKSLLYPMHQSSYGIMPRPHKVSILNQQQSPTMKNTQSFQITTPLLPQHAPSTSSHRYRNLFFICMVVFVPTIVLLTLIPCKTFEFIEGLWKPMLAWTSSDTPQYHRGTPIRIVMLGDSLMNRPMNKFNLGGQIQAFLPQYTLEFTNCGFDGTGIGWILNNSLPRCALPVQPDAVILFYHTDASDTDEASMEEEEVNSLHQAYRKNLAMVLDTLVKTGAFVALTSTGILGETKTALFQPHTARFHKKIPILNEYCAMNREAADSFGIPYINLRQALMDYIPCTQLSYAWCVTLEGEHLNKQGVAIQARLFADTLKSWLTTTKAANAYNSPSGSVQGNTYASHISHSSSIGGIGSTSGSVSVLQQENVHSSRAKASSYSSVGAGVSTKSDGSGSSAATVTATAASGASAKGGVEVHPTVGTYRRQEKEGQRLGGVEGNENEVQEKKSPLTLRQQPPPQPQRQPLQQQQHPYEQPQLKIMNVFLANFWPW